MSADATNESGSPPAASELLPRAVQMHQAGRIQEAIVIYRTVLTQDPKNCDALNLLGVALLESGDTSGGEALIRAALAIRPDTPPFLNNLGKALAEQDRPDEAIAIYRRAVELAPDYGEGHYNLAVTLQATGDSTGAEAAYRAAADAMPADLRPLANLGAMFKQQGRYDEAEGVLQAVLTRVPTHAEALTNLAYIRMALGDHRAAQAMYERAIAARPDEAVPFRALLVSLLYDPDLDAEARFAVHRRFEDRLARPHYAKARPFANHPDPGRKLRIGWLSADLADHPVARNLEPFFAHAARDQFEHFFYAELAHSSAVQERLKAVASGWRSTAKLSDEQVSEQIRADRIDILMVLAGRFDRNRPLVAAFKPAPIQVSLFDAATSGLEVMDYFIADSVMVPARRKERFTERPLRLPNFYIHAPLDDAPPVSPLPLASRGYVTFGCFNNPVKINDRVLALWAHLLARIPDARLVLKYADLFGSARVQAHVARVMAEAGIEPSRIDMGGTRESAAAHLARYAEIDIALDPFPFTGSTTTFEALWMGVPVVSLLGDSFMSRWTPSMLRKVGLEQLVAANPDEYVEIAARLAADRQGLAELRDGLRSRVAASVLCNPRRTTRYLQRALRAAWRRWCCAQGRGAAPIIGAPNGRSTSAG